MKVNNLGEILTIEATLRMVSHLVAKACQVQTAGPKFCAGASTPDPKTFCRTE